MRYINWREIISFCLVGVFTFGLDYGALYFCTEILGINYLYSAGLSFSLAVLINYVLCLKFVFTLQGRQTGKGLMFFVLASMVGLGLNQFCMWFLVEKQGIYYLLAKIVATGIVMVWNYVAKKRAIAS